jgi:hypothetical protein
VEENGPQLGDLSSEGSPPTNKEATWLPRWEDHSCGTAPGSHRTSLVVRYPGQDPGRVCSIAGSEAGSPTSIVGFRVVCRITIVKKLLPVLVTAAAAAIAVAAVRLLEDDPLPTQPVGSWELDEDESTS